MALWTKQFDIANVEQTICINSNETILDIVEKYCNRYKNSEAYENFGVSITYDKVNEISDKLASFFMHELKIPKQSTIAVHLPNVLQFPIVNIAALKAGLKIVNMNPLYTPQELKYIINDSQAEIIVSLENCIHNIADIQNEIPRVKHIIVTKLGDLFGIFKKNIINFSIRYIKKMINDYNFSTSVNILSWNDIFKKKLPQYNKIDIGSDDIAFLQYTSGTVNNPKGVILKHKNIVANINQILAYTVNTLERMHETFLTILPLYHSFGLMLNMWIAFCVGAKSVLITNPKEIDFVINMISKCKVSVLIGVEVLFKLFLDNEKFRKLDFKYLKVCLSGGCDIDIEIINKWYKLTGVPIVSGYGLSEASPCVACNFIDNINYRYNTIGVPLPNTQISFDSPDVEIEANQKGVLWIKGPQVSCGYWNNEEETKKHFIDGWLKTDDVATITNEGFLKILGRVSDMINISGFSVSPIEIEEVYNKHPKIKACAAIHDTNNDHDIIKLFVVLNEFEQDPDVLKEIKDELIEYSKDKLTNYKRPHKITFISELPKNNLGKIMRKKLK